MAEPTIFTFTLDDVQKLASLTSGEVKQAINDRGLLGDYKMKNVSFERFYVNHTGCLTACYKGSFMGHFESGRQEEAEGYIDVWLTPRGLRVEF
jgi:hypothetical protein